MCFLSNPNPVSSQCNIRCYNFSAVNANERISCGNYIDIVELSSMFVANEYIYSFAPKKPHRNDMAAFRIIEKI